jgi:dolichol-phosphate mannosyltransferase
MRTSQPQPMLSIVVPVYKEEDNVPEFLKRMATVLAPLTAEYEIIFALDPSPDKTEERVLEQRAKDERIKLLKFSRRVGQPLATLAGLQYARGDAMIVIDVDLQDPPEVIPQMLAKWREGYDVVIPQRVSRTGEPWIKRTISAWGHRFIERTAHVQIPRDTGDFRLMSRRVIDELNRLPESHGFLRGLTAVVGFRQALIPFERPARFAGTTSYNRFVGNLPIGLNGFFCFSSYLPTLIWKAGGAFCTLAILGALIAGVVALFGGAPPLRDLMFVFGVLFLGGVQLISVGILGEYITRIYDEVKRRPKFIIDRAVGFEQPASKS